VDRVEVQCSPAVAALAAKENPQSGLEAKFSVGYAVLVALDTGAVDEVQFSDAAVQVSPHRRTDRIALLVEPKYGIREAGIRVVTRTGAIYAAEIGAVRNTGRSVSDSDPAPKFRSLVTPVLGKARARMLEAAITGSLEIPVSNVVRLTKGSVP
jgi:hypothetical protein